MSLFRGVVGGDCGSTAEYYRNELLKLGFPKSALRYLVIENTQGREHVVLTVDGTMQINQGSWVRIKAIKGGL